MNILIHPQTEEALEKLLRDSPHAILFSGNEGAGKTYVAKVFSATSLGLSSIDTLENYPYFRIISPHNTVISIEQIRNLQKFLQLKTPGVQSVRRVIIIEDAGSMNTEAQNALLKTLEEPPDDTVIILTAPSTQKLKATIYSRVTAIPVLPVSKGHAEEYFQNSPAEKLRKAFAISGGQAGLLSALVNDAEHPLIKHIDEAKELLSASKYERLKMVEELAKQKPDIPTLLYALKIICIAALNNAARKNEHSQITRWHSSLKLIYNTESALQHNPNTKLLLTSLLLQL